MKADANKKQTGEAGVRERGAKICILCLYPVHSQGLLDTQKTMD